MMYDLIKVNSSGTMRLSLLFIAIIFCLKAGAQETLYNKPAWQELKSKIESHSIVGLGEIGHGYESINAAKSFVFDFLRNQLNFNAIVFESSFTECAVGYLKNDSLNNRIKNSLYPFWNTSSVRAVLKLVYNKEQQRQQPLILGCDIQEDCRFLKLSEFLNREDLVNINKNKLAECDSILSLYIGKSFIRKGVISQDEYNRLIRNYELIALEIKAQKLPVINQKLLTRCIDNRKWLCKYLTISNITERMIYRDSLMAENVLWLKKELFKEDKIALWAANLHISKLKENQIKPKWMGEWLSLYFKSDYYAISFQKGASPNSDFLQPDVKLKYFPVSEKFDAVIYLEKIKKINSREWLTPCD